MAVEDDRDSILSLTVTLSCVGGPGSPEVSQERISHPVCMLCDLAWPGLNGMARVLVISFLLLFLLLVRQMETPWPQGQVVEDASFSLACIWQSTFHKDAPFTKLQEMMCGLSTLPWRPNSTAASSCWRRRRHSSPELPWSNRLRKPRRRRRRRKLQSPRWRWQSIAGPPGCRRACGLGECGLARFPFWVACRWGRTAVDVLLSDCQFRKGTAGNQSELLI